jgi:uncharacterized alpha-E superfamily protein
VLSRIAESMFWIGRYVERAEDTARILDVQTQLLLEDSTGDEETTCRNLLSVMGVEPPEGRDVDLSTVLGVLAYDVTAPASIAAVLAAARESARRARETLSVTMWEALNTTHRHVTSHQFRRMGQGNGFRWVRDRAALINGAADATMTRDEGWQFLILGRMIERADMTSRLVATAAIAAGVGSPWSNTLRACGGHEAFLRTYKGLETERGAAEFLLLDRLFPRSIISSVIRAEDSLREIDPRAGRVGVTDQARRLLGQIRSEFEYRPIAEILTDLSGNMEHVQDVVSGASEAIRQRYFPASVAPVWIGEVS